MKYETIGIMILDPIDIEMPEGVSQVVISEPYTEEETLIDVPRIREYYKKSSADAVREIRNTFKAVNSELLVLNTSESFVGPVRKFFMGR